MIVIFRLIFFHRFLGPSWSCRWCAELLYKNPPGWRRWREQHLYSGCSIGSGKMPRRLGPGSHGTERKKYIYVKSQKDTRDGVLLPMVLQFYIQGAFFLAAVSSSSQSRQVDVGECSWCKDTRSIKCAPAAALMYILVKLRWRVWTRGLRRGGLWAIESARYFRCARRVPWNALLRGVSLRACLNWTSFFSLFPSHSLSEPRLKWQVVYRWPGPFSTISSSSWITLLVWRTYAKCSKQQGFFLKFCQILLRLDILFGDKHITTKA